MQSQYENEQSQEGEALRNGFHVFELNFLCNACRQAVNIQLIHHLGYDFPKLFAPFLDSQMDF